VAYQIEVILMTLSDLHGHSPIAGFSNGIFHTAVQQLTRFQLIEHIAWSLSDS